MSSLLEIVRRIRPERSLLLSYAAPPLVIETLLLRSLQTRGAGDVTVLVDDGTYREALVEAESAQWAGVHYEYLPVRMNGSGVFHPKFYLLLTREEAHLLVSSANLSPSSLHENAEVLEHLVLPREGPGDAAAFLDAADFLRALSHLPEDVVPEPARARLAEFQAEIEERALSATEGSGARLLHSLGRPLLERLAERVDPAGIREIFVISPFFDAECRALLALAERFGNSRICVITRGSEATNLHREKLAGLRDRLDIRAFGRAGGLRLHAKSLLLRGAGGSWLFTGSANLTAPAWFPYGRHGSNVEVGVLRVSVDPEAFAPFGIETAGAVIPWDQLNGRAPVAAVGDGNAVVVLWVRDAVEENGRVRITCSADAAWAQASARVSFASAGFFAEVQPRLEVHERALVLTTALPDGGVAAEGSVTARVELLHPDGRRAEAITWLRRPLLASLPARERRWRRMVVRLEQQGWDDDPETYEVMLDFCQGMLETLRSRQQEKRAPDEPPPPLPGPRPLPTQSSDTPPRLLERAAATMHRAITGESGEGMRAMAERQRQGRGRGTGGPSAAERSRNARQDRWLTRLVPALFATQPTPETLDDVALQLDLFVRLILRRYVARLADPKRKGQPEELVVHFPRLLAHAFSLDGAERGEPQGWFVRIWMQPELRDELRRVFQVPERRAVLLYLLALSYRLSARTRKESAEVGGVMLRGILAGAGLAMGEAEPWTEPETRAHIERLADEFVTASEAMPSGEAVAESLPRLFQRPIRQLQMVRRFLAMLQAESGAPLRAEGALEDRYRALRSRRRMPLADVLTPEERPTCGACYRSLSAARWNEIQAATDDATCPHCGVVLTPFRDRERAEALLHALEDLQGPDGAR